MAERQEADRWSDVAQTLSMLHHAQVVMLPGLIALRVEVSAPSDENDDLPRQRLQIGIPPEYVRQIARQLLQAADFLEGKGEPQ